MSPIKHPNVKSTQVEAVVQPGGLVEMVLMVNTDLELDATNPAYDDRKVSSLLIAVQDYLKVSMVGTRAHIRTVP